jgi:hypothetical protein
MTNVSLIHRSNALQLTVGRATTSGATAANSTNIVSNVSPLALPTSSPCYYISAYPPENDANGHQINLNGHAIDAPGAGTFYYTIWMYSDTTYNYSDMAAVLTVLKIE